MIPEIIPTEQVQPGTTAPTQVVPPGAPDNDDETGPPEPAPQDLFDYALSSLMGRMTLIDNHMQATLLSDSRVLCDE